MNDLEGATLQIQGHMQAAQLFSVISCNCPTCKLLANKGPEAILRIFNG